MDVPKTRREYLYAASAVGLLGFGGCSSDDPTGTPDGAATNADTADGASGGSSGAGASADDADNWPTSVDGWPQFQRDGGQTGAVRADLGLSAGVERVWHVGRGNAMGPVIEDGTAYFGSYDSPGLFAVRATDGTEVWRREALTLGGSEVPLVPDSIPAVAGDTVVVGDGNGIHAFSTGDGSDRWSDTSTDTVGAAPTIHDGTIYYAADAGYRALSLDDGSENWRYEVSPAANTVPVRDGTAYAIEYADTDRRILALDSDDGTEVWTHERSETSINHVAVDEDSLYVSASREHDDDPYPDGTVVALDRADGTERWSVDFDFEVRPSPAVFDGTVYLGANVNLYALDAADGSERWRFDMRQYGGDPSSATVIGETVCFKNGGGRIFGVDATDGTELWSVGGEGSSFGAFGEVVASGEMLLSGGATGVHAYTTE